jgi:hypothetical protein
MRGITFQHISIDQRNNLIKQTFKSSPRLSKRSLTSPIQHYAIPNALSANGAPMDNICISNVISRFVCSLYV